MLPARPTKIRLQARKLPSLSFYFTCIHSFPFFLIQSHDPSCVCTDYICNSDVAKKENLLIGSNQSALDPYESSRKSSFPHIYSVLHHFIHILPNTHTCINRPSFFSSSLSLTLIFSIHSSIFSTHTHTLCANKHTVYIYTYTSLLHNCTACK